MIRTSCLVACCLFASSVLADRQTYDNTKTQIAYRMPTPPVIDGIANQEEWTFANYHPRSGAKGWFWQVRFDDRFDDDGNPAVADSIRGGANGDGAVNPPTWAGDLGFAVFAGYDDQYLYIAVRVDDDVIQADSAEAGSENGTTWLDDSVEVFIDGDNSNFATRDTTGENPEIINTGGQFVITVNNAYRHAEAGNPTFGENGQWFARTALREDGSGYDAEFKIALSKIGNPKFGDVIGFSVAVNDDDDGGPLERQLMWAGRPHVEESYGNLVIGGKSYTAPKVSQAPTVDGIINASEYAGAQELVVNIHTGIFDLREGDDDFPLDSIGFSAWVVHDAEAIYVAIHAKDDVIRNDNADPGSVNGNTWDDDSVEIYFDADDSNDVGRGSKQYEGQYVFTANKAIRTAEANDPVYNQHWFAQNSIVAGGYTTEFKVLKSALLNPQDGASLGFHIDMNDDDGNLNRGRRAQIGWSGRSHAEFTYGVLTLAPGQGTTTLSIQSARVVGNEIELVVLSNGPVGKHKIQRSSSVTPAQWSDMNSTISAGGQQGTVSARFPKPSGSEEYYRAVLLP